MADEAKRTGFKTHRMPDKSVLFNRLIPLLFVVLGLVTLALIVFAIGIVTGMIHWI